MRLNLNISNCRQDLSQPELDRLFREASTALHMIQQGIGDCSGYLGWRRLADEENRPLLERIGQTAREIGQKAQALVVIGIGGSYLGAKAALDFIKSPNFNSLPKDAPDIYFAGNGFSPDAVQEIIDMVGDRDFAVNVISKSGTTTEPAIVFRIFRQLIEARYGRTEAARRIYVTTDPERGALHAMAEQEGYTCFPIPRDVGGRYSVFSAVGLLPLAAAGVDLVQLLSGVADVFRAGEQHDFRENPALLYAAVRNGLYRKGKRIEILAGFEPALCFTGEWWKQLFGESEGKRHGGLFPAYVNFTADLHSMGQYIQQGLRILLETIIEVETSRTPIDIPYDRDNFDGLNYLACRPLGWTNTQAMQAAASAHRDGGVPNMTITIPDRSARSFGELAGFFELACAISGLMMGVNPFDQPGVEAYKENMFALLGKTGYVQKQADLEVNMV